MGKNVMLLINRISICWFALSLAAVATVLVASCGGTPATPIQPGSTSQSKPSPISSLTPVAVANVKIIEKNGKYAFEPATLRIKARTQVIWTNSSGAIHTITSDTLTFNTNNLATNQVFSVIFINPGTYPYYCNIHTYMLGTIIVTP